ncbi:MAG TPA: malto-oligosyltrehalose trehalohydrolase [Acidimicrobiales bacterium]|nr:malto-oligosyltrehalose trehalohydrolase [Acidimicrobiales bacterium]
MTARRVWAPRARAVELDLAGHRTAMRPAGGGWFEVDVGGAEAATDYRFSLDGGAPLPDPRSPWQPHGTEGASRAVDHASFTWHDAGWRPPPLASSVLYELHVGTFSGPGTFDGVVTRLDHLVELGATAVELMPLAEFPGRRGWGYDGVFPFAPHHAYGGPEGLQRLVDACHGRGLAVVIDVVYNHLGPSGNVLPAYGPYLYDRYRTPWGEAVNLDGPGSDEVRRYFIDNALMWLRDYHADGLRLDAVHAIVDTSAVHFLEQMATEVEVLAAHLGRPLWLIAESDLNDPRLVRRRDAGGYGLDAQWDDDFHHAVHALLTGERDGYYADFGTAADVATVLRHRYLYRGQYSTSRQRRHGRDADDVPGWRFVAFTQNHDQVGNRATGERSAALMSPAGLRLAAALVCLAPFVPLLFEGEEWGASTPFLYFTDHTDAELGRAVTEGRRHEFAAFGWGPEDVPDPQAEATWEASRLRWDEVGEPGHVELLEWYRALLRLRREHAGLTDGRCDRVEVTTDEDARTIVVRRGAIVLAAHFGDGAAAACVPTGATAVLVFPPGASSADGARVEDGRVSFDGEGVVVLCVQPGP